MRQITLNIPDSEFPFFMKLVNSLPFVQVADPEQLDMKLTSSQRETWQLIKNGFDEFKEVKQGKRRARPVQDLLDDLED
ncbi:hypothetical protein [Arsenicibacter rosenii]|uniref:Uncharacterized protein n=1 Tax=Arsenicibacter rosenii TaxID=1750698 RepID=A0A1S2VPT0_9BACT|nr:hypothetical protein [Arsenicibacter rosenii]OIN60390.1 hypothetical protein BLX24_06080 [Arsenicibacter rosenii]